MIVCEGEGKITKIDYIFSSYFINLDSTRKIAISSFNYKNFALYWLCVAIIYWPILYGYGHKLPHEMGQYFLDRRYIYLIIYEYIIKDIFYYILWIFFRSSKKNISSRYCLDPSLYWSCVCIFNIGPKETLQPVRNKINLKN